MVFKTPFPTEIKNEAAFNKFIWAGVGVEECYKPILDVCLTEDSLFSF